MYGIDVTASLGEISIDHVTEMKTEYRAFNEGRSNLRYGYVAKA